MKTENNNNMDKGYSGIKFNTETHRWETKVTIGKVFNYQGSHLTEKEAVKFHSDAIEDAKLYYI